VHAAPFARRRPLALAGTVLANVRGFADALAILHRARPDVLIATGGYVAFPVVAALRFVRLLGRTRARIALLEPNAVAGLTNRLLAPLVDEIWYAQPPAGRVLGPKESVLGTPVRASMRRPLAAAEARRALGLASDATTVVVMGGSQGARSLNDAAAALVEAGGVPQTQLLILAGSRDAGALSARLAGMPNARVLAYLDDPRVAYAAADLVVARAGASTLAELAATGTPALLVPYPHATDDHQSHNARIAAASGAARVLADRELDAVRLRAELEALLAPDALATMRAAAAHAARRDPSATIVARVKAWRGAKT
jgi:UDP-N-acetylglucosamine--N-acetylmuramyl-(pentapeptide) pyrophosphoryl-undecaprenol N-acetylglucosamine transferase